MIKQVTAADTEKKFLRLPKVLERLPMGKSTWWQGIRDGKYPRPIKLSKRTSAWLKGDIDALCDRLAEAGKSQGCKSKRSKPAIPMDEDL